MILAMDESVQSYLMRQSRWPTGPHAVESLANQDLLLREIFCCALAALILSYHWVLVYIVEEERNCYRVYEGGEA